MLGSSFDCPPRYEWIDRYTDLKPIGLGSFGLVCSAKDSVTHEPRAIKKISKPFENATLAKRAFRELILLAHLQHDNIICLHDAFLTETQDLYFVTDLLGADLQRLLDIKPLEATYIRFFSFQILHGLRYVHAAGVIHRDLKPANILVNENCDLKICDFGLGKFNHFRSKYSGQLTWQQGIFQIQISWWQDML